MCKNPPLLWRILIGITKLKVSYEIKQINKAIIYPNRPVIWVVNHQRFFDFPIALRAIAHPVITLSGKQRLYLLDRLWFNAMKVIWVDRKDKENRRLAVSKIGKSLRENHEVLWFPEGTWNMSENLLMLPMKWGIIDIAKNTGAQIIPMLMEYVDDENTVYIRYAPTIITHSDNKIDAINNLRDTMATERWKFMESRGVYQRAKLDIDKERRKLWNALKEYPPLDWNYERSVIFDPYKSLNFEPYN